MSLRSIVREPLVHFALIGMALFMVFGQMAPLDAGGTKIVISQAAVDDLARQYAGLWGRPPGSRQLASLVEANVRDEILYREGMALGLGRDDALIKRRVRQKLEIMLEEAAATAPPSDADLADYMARNPRRFMQPSLVSFEQIYFAFDEPGDVEQRLAAARAAADRGTDVAALGDATLLPRRGTGVSIDLVARDFGAGFAEELRNTPLDRWSGPLRSAYGVHLVRVTERTPPRLPSLATVRSVVAREWENDRRKRALEVNYRRLRDAYVVVIEAKQPLPTAPRP